ncbi:hypothetical protein [Pedobacter psychroterrae]|uniref:Uncharacterized protein n=1 Tax=Pedobacter psychroterrae TaxID=2530453 RepID=A0A4R0NKH2_9SPHI|nr:hypothetical protein [Pedobacter psychroterrae]TCD01270.1 hypothetical protein EZ437_10980 [Pedobacter psychroterrae]
MIRYNQIKELIEFNLNTTLNDLEVIRNGAIFEGEPISITIMGKYGFGKTYSLTYEYEWLKEKQDIGELSIYLLQIRENIIKENN